MNRTKYDQDSGDLNDPAKPAWLDPSTIFTGETIAVRRIGFSVLHLAESVTSMSLCGQRHPWTTTQHPGDRPCGNCQRINKALKKDNQDGRNPAR